MRVARRRSDEQDLLYDFARRFISVAESSCELITAKRGGIDLLLTDVVMAGMSGPRLAERARLDYPAVAEVFTRGYDRR
jgi:CheY-like chemotaxis protein